MKKLIILLLLSYTLFAQNINSSMPLALQKKLCDKLAQGNNRCENSSTLEYSTHAKLTDEKLLLFVYLNEHTNRFTPFRNATPILIDQLGRWVSTVGDNIISENIESIHQDPHGNIWVRALWQSEGVYPTYYHSQHGLKWKQTVLPKDRNIDCCFEFVDKPAFLYNTISFTFRDSKDKNVKSWGATYQSAMSSAPIWQPLAKAPTSTIEPIANNNWKATKSKNKITFRNSYSNKQIILPLSNHTNTKSYQIQLGAYSKKSSAKKVKSKFKNIMYPIYTVQSKKYLKLVIGKFTTHKKAKFILNKLKREHPKNKDIQKAFILTSKP